MNVRTVACVAAGVALLAVTGSQPRASASTVAGGYIVYSDKPRAGSSAELLRMRPDGTGRRRLTWNGTWDGQADASPDGRRIAFIHGATAGADSSGEVATAAAADGGTLRTLAAGEFVGWPRWSPRGGRVAYQEQCGYGSSGESDDTCISIQLAGRKRSVALSVTGSSRETIAIGSAWSWAHDGRLIAYERRRGTDGDLLDVAIVDIASGAHRIVTRGSAPTFSPRERVLAVTKGGGIALVGMNGTIRRWIFRATSQRGATSPSWSPDGRHLAFWQLDLSAIPREPVLLVADLRTGVTRSVAVRANDWSTRIIWSPDGRHLAFSDGSSDLPWVYRVDLDRKPTSVRVARGYAWDWAPDAS